MLPSGRKKMTDLPQTSHIKLDLRGGVLHLWLNRPERRNALSSQMVAEIATTFAAVAADRSVRIVVLRGAGGTFCAGGDIANMSVAQASPPPGAPDELRDNNRRFGAMLEVINTAPQAVIAAVEGYAMGGGFGLACVADVTITTANARFALSEATIGVVAAAVSPFVVRRIGGAAARRLGVTAMRIDGAEALSIGLANLVVPDGAALDAAIRETCNYVLKCAPHAIAVTKRLMLRAAGSDAFASVLDDAAASFAASVRGAEGREGTAAFVEKRKPSWVTQAE
jgi:isohexenylglutaconyl-CoA hydratase